MDFDSLKITPKSFNNSYENQPSDSSIANLSTPTTASTASAAAEVSSDVATSDEGGNSAASGSAIETNNGVFDSNELYQGEAFLNKLDKAINELNKSLKNRFIKTQFSYRVHKETNRVIVDVKNSETGEVIREIPSEKDLDILAKLREMAGIIVDENR